MGLFNTFKNRNQKQEAEYKIDNSMYNISPPKGEMETYVTKKMNELDSSLAFKSINSRVSETARDTYREMIEREFNNQYKELKAFQLALEFKEKHGITTDTYLKFAPKYDALVASGLLDENNKKCLFLPYLLEREKMGIITDKERRELGTLKNSGDVNKTYKAVAILYQLLGFGNLEDENFLKESFPEYGNISNYKDDKIVSISRHKLGEVAELFGQKLGISENMTSGKSR